VQKERELEALMAIEREVCEKDAREERKRAEVFILGGMWTIQVWREEETMRLLLRVDRHG
jgi:hypothetical protein